MTAPVPVAVVGAGSMGENHLRVYDELPNATLTEAVEPDAERADSIRSTYDIPVHSSIDDISASDAASITVPNTLHRSATQTCLEDGLDVLVEKPLAMAVDDARHIVETARAQDAILQVGHIERFNPAVEALGTILASETVLAIEAHRLGPFNDHLTDESVVFDLMIHDLDVISSLVGAEIDYLNAVGRTAKSNEYDHAVAQMQFENGVIGTTTASHVTHGKVRTLNVVTADAYITLDYQEQDMAIQRRGVEQTTTMLEQSGYRTETVSESPFIARREPLKKELDHFVDCVRSRETPRVDGTDGVKAVEQASAVIESIRETNGN